MSKISSSALLQNLPDFLRRIGEGETFTITDDGEALAELGPARKTPLERLEAAGQVRKATASWTSLPAPRAKLPDGVTSADIIADVRGYDRGY